MHAVLAFPSQELRVERALGEWKHLRLQLEAFKLCSRYLIKAQGCY
jgi:hypothetical protein